MSLEGIALVVMALSALLLVVFAFVIAWKYMLHKTAEPSAVEAQLHRVESEFAGEIKTLKLRILSLEGGGR